MNEVRPFGLCHGHLKVVLSDRRRFGLGRGAKAGGVEADKARHDAPHDRAGIGAQPRVLPKARYPRIHRTITRQSSCSIHDGLKAALFKRSQACGDKRKYRDARRGAVEAEIPQKAYQCAGYCSDGIGLAALVIPRMSILTAEA